ncbi:MAG: type VI secretion system-associated FHA domain protein TagH [Rhodocyclaceae bacterium]|nr:type VI secretion system-associated FHA domain protein TagH [Rhodocyclaceae bacterium]
MELSLIILGPEQAEPREVVLREQQAIIGRDPACTVVLPDPEKHLSRNHIAIDYSGTAYVLTVSSRVNAVYVNDTAYRMGQSVALADGDRIWMPPYEIRVKLALPSQAAAAPPAAFGNTGMFDYSAGSAFGLAPTSQAPADPLNVADFLAPAPAAPKVDERDAFELRNQPAAAGPGGLLDGLGVAPAADFDLLHAGNGSRAAASPIAAPPPSGLDEVFDPGAKSIDDILGDGAGMGGGRMGSPVGASGLRGVNPVVDLGHDWGGGGASALDHVHDINLPMQAPPIFGAEANYAAPAGGAQATNDTFPARSANDDILANLDDLLGDLIQPGPAAGPASNPAAAAPAAFAPPPVAAPAAPPVRPGSAAQGLQGEPPTLPLGATASADNPLIDLPPPEPGIFDDILAAESGQPHQLPPPEPGLFDDLLAPATPAPAATVPPRPAVQPAPMAAADKTIASAPGAARAAAGDAPAASGAADRTTVSVPQPLPAPAPPAARAVAPDPSHLATHPGWEVPQKAAAPDASAAAAVDKLLAELLAGLGLQNLKLAPDERERFLRNVGEVARAAIEGIIKLLSSRSLLKQELRVAERTMLARRDNNALKVMEDTDEAVRFLFDLRQSMPGAFMSPVPSIRDACDDLCAHEIALVAGVRAAVAASLKRFNPEQYQELAAKSPGSLLTNKRARCWDLFVADYAKMDAESADNIDRLFERDFLAAYMDQVKRLRK